MNDYADLLQSLGFQPISTDCWQRRFNYPATGEFIISVDTHRKTIDYPLPIVVGDRTTSNFDHPENFVVLECVCRLLEKGYDPATLILEKRYQVGRGASGGKSDVTVLRRSTDPTEQAEAPPLLIIECKTWGAEHEAEKLKTLENGGQLFGYLQQDRSATHLCIYSSHIPFELIGEIEYRCDIIAVEDTPEALEKFARKEKAESRAAALDAVPLFQNAFNRESLHHAWKTSYGSAFQSSGIFEDDFTPYAIGYIPKRGKDLKEFSSDNGSTRVFNSFMEILRHNNVSDKENAFNRLCAIILAKLIDEDRTPEAILDFQWFPNKDSAEDLIDRLQRLYKRGMKETLGEDITYFEERDIDQAFMAHRRDMAKNEVKKIFRALKFYTNSDFAFKEVHNKKLFEQNTQVVREVVELLQGYRLKYTSKQAFLGNLFELLLNSGFKQSEGQFFTPIPIARFIVRCLPLRERIAAAQQRSQQQVIPRVMDYACGSAHFLTEIIEELHEDLAALDCPEAVNTTWTRDAVWGIEKDYRLARTAKIALFLHGAGDANILHEDGLDHANPKLPALGTLDVLVANPPYSVKDFKQHLRLQEASFTLLPYLTANSSEIETLFVERAAQLLRVGGLAGLILPSSILSNAGIYQRTRALLLEKFLLRGIVELGGSAFIATGTNTAILLLERRPETHREHLAIRADSLFNEDKRPNDADFADSDLLRTYTQAAGLDFADYCAWLADAVGELPAALEASALFAAYQKDFNDLADTKRRQAQVSFKKLTLDEQRAELRGKFLRHCRDAEKLKFLHFALAHVAGFEQGELIPQYSTVLRGAGSKDEEQAFLGYKWSQRRGAEGMVFLREPYDGGLLYTPGAQQRDEQAGKAAYYLRRAFQNLDHETPPENAPLHDKLRIAPTSAYFDFTRTGCDLAVNLAPSTADTSPVFDTRYPLAQLGDIAEIEQGQSPPSSAYNRDGNGLLFFQGSKDFGEYELIHSGVWTTEVTRKAVKGDLLMSVRAPVGELNRNPFQEICIGRGLAKLTPSKAINPLYFYHCLNVQKENIIGHKNLGFASISKREIEEIPIPLPPIEVQQRIVQAIEAIEAAEKKARESIATAQQAIETALLLCEGINPIQLNKLALINPPKIVEGLNDDSPISFIEMASVSDKGGLLNVATRHYGEVKTGYTNFIQGDIILAKITPCMENGKIAYLDSLPSQIGFGSTEFFVIRTNNKNTAKVIYHYLNRPAFRKPAERAMTGASGHRRVPKDFLEQFLLPDLSPTEQQNLLDEITRHEAQRAAAETELAAAPAKKRQILLDGIK